LHALIQNEKIDFFEEVEKAYRVVGLPRPASWASSGLLDFLPTLFGTRKALFSWRNFLVLGTVILSFVFDNYCQS
jgi:hypothetical protein